MAIKIKSTALRLWFRFRLSFSLFWENFSLSFLLSLDLKVELETGTLFLAFISVCFVCLALLQFSQLGFFPFFFPAQQINITKIRFQFRRAFHEFSPHRKEFSLDFLLRSFFLAACHFASFLFRVYPRSIFPRLLRNKTMK